MAATASVTGWEDSRSDSRDNTPQRAEVFPQPQLFDIRRNCDQQHLAFGFGPHVCIAGQLVRLVTALLFGELLDRYPRFELAGRPEPLRHVLRNGWRSAPIVFGTSPVVPGSRGRTYEDHS